jgi:putative phosphoesterase
VRIGILSDTHNAKHNTQTALETFRQRGITQLIHCGDITSPDMVYLFSGWQVTFVFGNMDSAWIELGEAANRIGVIRPKLSHEVEIDGVRIGVTHGADQALLYRMMISGKYAYLCHGHTHERRNEFRSAYNVRLLNPGALGGNHPQARSVCILDAATGEVEFIEFPTMA